MDKMLFDTKVSENGLKFSYVAESLGISDIPVIFFTYYVHHIVNKSEIDNPCLGRSRVGQ